MANAAERVYEHLRTAIVGGSLEPGARVREEDLAEEIGVSRTPVREALRRLGADGLVVLTENRGAQVASWSERDLDEIFGLRALLEGYGARLAATTATPGSIAEARALCARMDDAAEASDLDAVAELNQAFHALVLGSGGNRRLREAVSRLIETPLVHRTFRHYSGDALHRSLAHHHELVDALEAGDGAWAESVMRSHVHAGRAAVFGRPTQG